MFTITTMFKPATVKFITSEWTSFAGLDDDVAIVDLNYDFEENEGLPIDPELRGIIAGTRADALHEFLKETHHF